MKHLSALLFLTASLDQAHAWWGNGHLMVARIGYDLLMAKNPEVVSEVNAILGVLKKSDPSWTTKEDKHPFVECVTFADDIKYKGGSYQSGWHFIDNPYLDQGGSIDDFDFKADEHNATEAISALVDWFNQKGDYKNSYEYQQVSSHGLPNHTPQDSLSTAMRLLLHYIGDIHQPLHATARVDKQYPEGDRGGNSFPLPSKEGAKNLHSVWDSVVYEFAGDFNLVSTENSSFGKDF